MLLENVSHKQKKPLFESHSSPGKKGTLGSPQERLKKTPIASFPLIKREAGLLLRKREGDDPRTNLENSEHQGAQGEKYQLRMPSIEGGRTRRRKRRRVKIFREGHWHTESRCRSRSKTEKGEDQKRKRTEQGRLGPHSRPRGGKYMLVGREEARRRRKKYSCLS